MDTNRVLILDYGSQYTQLIARRVRELSVYCEIFPWSVSLDRIQAFSPRGIILSGGPASVYDSAAPAFEKSLLSLRVPILGICYGMQMLAHAFCGEVKRSVTREYGRASIMRKENHPLWSRVSTWPCAVWMSHGDHVIKLPGGFRVIATSDNSSIAAMARDDDRIAGFQFHPEVTHTPDGKKLLEAFLFDWCELAPTWTMHSFIESTIAAIRQRVKKNRVVLGLSGGVDSTVAAVLLHKAIGDQLTCIFVDNGFLRKDEAKSVEKIFRNTFQMNLDVVDAKKRFLTKLAHVTDPEIKRKKAGEEFISVFEEEAKRKGNAKFLAQGTLYPDVIESVSFKGPSATIKTHHNVGGLPENMKLELIEPFRELFKDEVREVGRSLEIPEDMITRHPFPGPGLLIRVLGAVTEERLDVLREADDIMLQELRKSGWYEKSWQAFCVLLPVQTVGVMGDERTYENVIVVRSVESTDGMTADWSKLPHDLLATISNRIINEGVGVNRVVYDITSKPPGTIEWE